MLNSSFLAKALSSTAGTACFDKSPQSQSRGITLDLGFSNFKHNDKQFTIVDCPGHASLVRTVLCGAQIIDLIVLVIDATKGIQAQTAECLIVAEIMTKRLVFAINKIDLWPELERASKFESFKNKLMAAMKGGKFADSPIVPVSVLMNSGFEELKAKIDEKVTEIPVHRDKSGAFVFVVDHCFPIKGQGSVLTGTVLQGQTSVNDSIEIPELSLSRKIKSMQSFRENVRTISAGDRAGICVQSIDSELIERTLVCNSGNAIPKRSILILTAKRIKFFKGDLKSKMKLHISVLNEVVLCKQLIFVRSTAYGYEYLEGIPEDFYADFQVIIELDRPVSILPDSIVIASKFDADPSLQKCRIAFHGKWYCHEPIKLEQLKIYRVKHRYSQVDRIVSENRVICKGISASLENEIIGKKSSIPSITKYIGMKVNVYAKEREGDALPLTEGVIESLFGSTGKFNVTLKSQVKDSADLFIKLTFGKLLFRETDKKFCI